MNRCFGIGGHHGMHLSVSSLQSHRPPERHPARAIEQVCEIALSHGAYRLRTIRELIQRQGDRQEQIEFIDGHPIIRPLSDYEDLVDNRQAWQSKDSFV